MAVEKEAGQPEGIRHGLRIRRFHGALAEKARQGQQAVRIGCARLSADGPAGFRRNIEKIIACPGRRTLRQVEAVAEIVRSEEHTSELQSLMRISYAVFCLKK